MPRSFVIIQLGPAPNIAPGGPRKDALAGDYSRQKQAILDRFPGLQLTPVFQSMSAAPGPGGDRLSRYFQAVQPDEAAAKKLVAALKGLVAKAYVRSARAELPDNGARGRAAKHRKRAAKRKWVNRIQPYLRPAPLGVNAYWAWDRHRARGQNVTIVDIEQGWDLTHADLPPTLNAIGTNNPTGHGHGLAVLGILAARDNDTGIMGMSARANVSLISYFHDHDDDFNIAWAIEQALDPRNGPNSLKPGDILLLETQVHRNGTSLPVEVEEHLYDAIVDLGNRGILVIEPAGNSEINLDKVEDLRTGPKDSGALMVSGTIQVGPNDKHRSRGAECNYGKRVNCYAWGEGIRTLGMADFGGTSGASAIIAGAAALLQTVARRRFEEIDGKPGRYLKPGQLRDYLSNPNNGTLSVDADRRPIGVMPDLKKVIASFIKSHTLPDNGKSPLKANLAKRRVAAKTGKRRAAVKK